MNKILNIGLLSTCSIPGDVQGNLKQIEYFAEKAKANKCDVLLTPELSVTGYGGYEEVLRCSEIAGRGSIYRELSKISRKNQMILLAGFVEEEDFGKYLAHYIIYPDGRYAVQRKHRITPLEYPLSSPVSLYYDETEEIGHVPKGMEQFQYFYINNVKCVVIICADAGIRNLHAILDEANVKVVFLPVAAGGKREGKITNADLRTEEGIQKYYSLCNNEYFFPGQSILDCIHHNRCIAAVNMCGYDGKQLYHGGSGSIVTHFGEIAAHMSGIENIDRQKPMFVCAEVDFTEVLLK